MSLLETLVAVMLSAMLMTPVLGWAALSMKEQRTVVERNLSGASLGVLRTLFTRDVVNSDRAWVAGEHLADCEVPTKGAQTLLVLVTGDRVTTYATIPDEVDGDSQLVRAQCARAGETATVEHELVGNVMAAGTEATCVTESELAELAAAQRSQVKEQAGFQDRLADTSCVRVTLRLTTAQLDQIALTASRRSSGSESDAPIAVMTAKPTDGNRPLKVEFDGSSSVDPRGEELSYAWNFGDGATAAGVTATHEYTSVGTFTATLTVSTRSGRTGSTTVAITVGNNAPVAKIASPATGTKFFRGQKVSFSSAGSGDPIDEPYGGKVVSYKWDFGDGTTSVEANPSKTYATVSSPTGYVVTLTVVDDGGLSATASVNVLVVNRTPTVTLTASPSSGPSPLAVTFTAAVVDEPDMSPPPALTYAWDFGNGTTSTKADPGAVYYSTAGTFTAKVTVTDDGGLTASATQTVTVAAAGPAAPANLRKTNSGVEQGLRYIEMAWDRRDGATRYEVQLSCISCTEVATGQESGTTLRIRGLSNGAKEYNAQVRAMNSAGVWGPWSSPVKVKS